MNVEVIRTSGTREQHVIDGKLALRRIYKLIDCDTVDMVNLRDGRVMLVDDNGYEPGPVVQHTSNHIEITAGAARKPVNEEATKLYHGVCIPGTTHQIVGDVAIVKDEDFQ